MLETYGSSRVDGSSAAIDNTAERERERRRGQRADEDGDGEGRGRALEISFPSLLLGGRTKSS